MDEELDNFKSFVILIKFSSVYDALRHRELPCPTYNGHLRPV
jgi:hypothetical protein